MTFLIILAAILALLCVGCLFEYVSKGIDEAIDRQLPGRPRTCGRRYGSWVCVREPHRGNEHYYQQPNRMVQR